MRQIITREVLDWIEAMTARGMFVVGSSGDAELAPPVREVFDALHEVLAGGSVSIKIEVAGDGTEQKLLQSRLDAAMTSVNVDGGTDPSVFTP